MEASTTSPAIGGMFSSPKFCRLWRITLRNHNRGWKTLTGLKCFRFNRGNESGCSNPQASRLRKGEGEGTDKVSKGEGGNRQEKWWGFSILALSIITATSRKKCPSFLTSASTEWSNNVTCSQVFPRFLLIQIETLSMVGRSLGCLLWSMKNCPKPQTSTGELSC